MVLRKTGQVVVLSTFNSNEGGFVGIQQLQPDTVFYGNQPVARAVQYVDRTGYFSNPKIGAQVVAQHQLYR